VSDTSVCPFKTQHWKQRLELWRWEIQMLGSRDAADGGTVEAALSIITGTELDGETRTTAIRAAQLPKQLYHLRL
jgi:hypothetical protein